MRHIAHWVAGLALVVLGCAGEDDASEPEVGTRVDEVTASATLLVSADFAATSKTKTIVEAELMQNPAIQLLAVGDMSYTAPYADNDPWAAWASRTYPVMGNHEFNSVAGKGGQQPFQMFNGNNAAANHTFPAITSSVGGVDTFDFTYAHEVTPGWLLVVVNTGVNCRQQACTTQATQLASQISAWRASRGGHGCVMVAMHTARWSTMFSGDADNLPWATGVAPLWSAAVTSKADLVFQGHVHVYEEFKKLGVDGQTSATGAKLFTVGAGGRGQVKPLSSNIAASQLLDARAAPVHGVVKLALYPGAYGYRFETAATASTPAASVACNVP